MTTKTCKLCNKAKLIRDFGTRMSKKVGVGRVPLSQCKRCRAKWREDRPLKRKEHNRKSTLREYGLTPELYMEMFKHQSGRCVICGEIPCEIGLRYGLVVDHSHSSGKVRALLCANCNLGLGLFKDSQKLMYAAFEYISYWDNEHFCEETDK